MQLGLATPADAMEIKAQFVATGYGMADDEVTPMSVALRSDDGVLIGGVNGLLYDKWYYITAIWVDPKLRRQGAARKILNMACMAARERGATHIHTETRNPEALVFYQRYGFKLEGCMPDFMRGYPLWFLHREMPEIGPGDIDVSAMRLEVGAGKPDASTATD